MKRILLSIVCVCLSMAALHAQRLVIGEKAPEIRVSEWLDGRAPVLSGKAFLVDFFHSSNEGCVANLSKLNALQSEYAGRLNVIAVSREDPEKIRPLITGKGYGFYFGMDDSGKTFGNYGVRFVPFSALVDGRGRLVWTGNVPSLTGEVIDKALR